MSYKGRFTPRNPQKYKGDATNIVYRSLLERCYMVWFDDTPEVAWWQSEEVIVPYFSPVDEKMHRYFPDFIICIQNKHGQVRKIMIEIKPHTDLIEPTKRQWKRAKTWVVNQAKWAAAREWCKANDMEFEVMTDKHIANTYQKALPSNKKKAAKPKTPRKPRAKKASP